jgi:hypothetical protein
MKKFTKAISVLLTLCCIISLSYPAVQVSAAENSSGYTVLSTEKIAQDDGYLLVTIESPESSGASTRSTTNSKEARGVYSYYNASNVLCWSYTLNATFLYDGTLVACTKVSASSDIYKANWSACNESHSKKGNVASGSITFKNQTNHKDVSISITCSKNGTLTSNVA